MGQDLPPGLRRADRHRGRGHLVPPRLRRVADELGDLQRTRAQLRAVAADMVVVLGELGLSRLGDIPGLTAVGAAAILAETGDPRRYDSSSSLVKHAGLSPSENASGAFEGQAHISRTSRPGLRLNTAGYTAPAPATPEELAQQRRLSGAVFSNAQPGPGIAPSEINPVSGSPPESVSAAPSGTLAALLHAAPTPAAHAEILPAQRLLLPKGAFIDCTLETAIDSTLPGMTTCVMATDVFGVDGKVVLMERGTKLVGETQGQVQQGRRGYSCCGPKRVRPPAWSCPWRRPARMSWGVPGCPARSTAISGSDSAPPC